MAIDVDADLKAIAGDADLPAFVSATIGAASIDVILLDGTVEAGGVLTTVPTVIMAASDVAANSISVGTTITIGSTSYTVGEKRAGWSGMDSFFLEE